LSAVDDVYRRGREGRRNWRAHLLYGTAGSVRLTPPPKVGKSAGECRSQGGISGIEFFD